MSAAVVRGNALHLPLVDESVDLIVTSPPYFALRSYRDDDQHYTGQLGSEETPQAFLEALWAVTAECHRVLKPTGSMWVNLGDKYSSGGRTYYDTDAKNGGRGGRRPEDGAPPKSLLGLPWRYAIGCIDGQAAPEGQRWILRAEVVWSKPNGLPESVTDRVRRSHEQWFMFTKQGRYFAAVDEVREAHADHTVRYYKEQPDVRPPLGELAFTDETGRRGWTSGAHPLGKLPGSVWSIPSEPLIIPPAVARHYNLPDHFAAFPTEWPRRIILGWSPSGICVECGEGRRPVVAKEATGLHTDGRPRTNRTSSSWGGASDDNNWGDERDFQLGVTATITGYACACSDSAAPTKPPVILDPFGGTGTVAMVARALGRFGISLDLSADYCRLSKWRVFSSQHGEKAIQRTHRENQGDLLETS